MKRFLALALTFCLLWSPSAWALSKQFTAPGASIIAADSAQTPTVTWTLAALASGAGRVSGRYDKGAGSQPSLWEMRCRISLNGAYVAGAMLEYYVATSDGTDVDSGVGTADAAITTEQRRNLTLAGVLVVNSALASLTTMYASFRNIYIPNRYFSLAIWNATTLPIENSTSKHRCTM